MAHKVLVGGFASGPRQMEKVAQSLAAHYDEDVEAIPFREAMTDAVRLERMTRQADVITHSAGMVALKDMSPDSITAIAPPVPVWAPLLALRAIASTTELALHSVVPGYEPDEVNGCIRDGTAELLLHLEGNMRWMGQVALFDALKTSSAAQGAGIITGLALMRHDKLFQSHPRKIEVARRAGANIVVVSGVHEDFIKMPGRILRAYEQGGVTGEATGLITVALSQPKLQQLREIT